MQDWTLSDSKSYRVALCGLGRVGAQNPSVYSDTGDLIIRNHLEAILSAGVDLVAVIDPDLKCINSAFEKLPETVSPIIFNDLSQCPENLCDVLVIATPVVNRSYLYRHAIRLNPKVILVEKPCAPSVETGDLFLKQCTHAGIDVFVNFNRRCDGDVQKFKSVWPNEKPNSVLFRYGKGLKNYGSHIIDHIVQWFGPPTSVFSHGRYDEKNDNSVSFSCEVLQKFPVYVLGIDQLNYDMFEVDIYFRNYMLSMRNNGVEKLVYRSKEDVYYPSYNALICDQTLSNHAPIGGFLETYYNIGSFLSSRGHGPLCTFGEALMGLKIIESIQELSLKQRQGNAISYDAAWFTKDHLAQVSQIAV